MLVLNFLSIFRFTSLIFIAALVLVLYLLIKFWKSTSGYSAKIDQFLKEIDENYGDFIRKRINLAYLEDKDLKEEMAAIKSEALIILKPHISAMVHHIESDDTLPIQLKYKPSYFGSLPALLEANVTGKEQIIEAIEENMEANISARILDAKTGENLSI